MPLRPKYLARKLPQALPIKDGKVLRTIGDASEYLLELPRERAARKYWYRAFELILEQENAEAVEEQMRLALLLEARLDLSALKRRG